MSEAVGYAGATVIALCQVPQLLLTLRTRQTRGISVAYYGLLAAGVALMLAFALEVEKTPFIISNVAALSLVGLQLLLVAVSRYGGRTLATEGP